MSTTPKPPGNIQVVYNNDNSWTIRKDVDQNALFPVMTGPGGTEYNSTPPPGVATDGNNAISATAKTGMGIPNRGLTRFQTADRARATFAAKWTPEGPSTAKKGSFLSSLGSALIDKLKSDIPSTKTENADWKVHIEYSDKIGEQGVFAAFLADGTKRGLLSYSVKNFKTPGTGEVYKVRDVHKFTGVDGDVYSKGVGKWGADDLRFLRSELKNQEFDPNKPFNKPIGNRRDDRDFATETKKTVEDVIGPKAMNDLTAAMARWNSTSVYTSGVSFGRSFETYKTLMDKAENPDKRWASNPEVIAKNLEGGHLFAGTNRRDVYNSLLPFHGEAGKIPAMLCMPDDPTQSRDLVFFYFYDVVNGMYVPFRATVSSLNEVNNVDWEDIQYMGRADKLYSYKGFTRELNMNFTVYANSAAELIPMWIRINHLAGLARPPRYTAGTDTTSYSQFMQPPLVTFRVGDMYTDQPAVFRSISVTVPDDATWESHRGEYEYGTGNVKISSKADALLDGINGGKIIQKSRLQSNSIVTGQLPTRVDIGISMALLEKERSQTGNLLFFPDTKIVTGGVVGKSKPIEGLDSFDPPTLPPAGYSMSGGPQKAVDYSSITPQKFESVTSTTERKLPF